jgi:hypothetical protein
MTRQSKPRLNRPNGGAGGGGGGDNDVKHTIYEAPHYAVFSSHRLFSPS